MSWERWPSLDICREIWRCCLWATEWEAQGGGSPTAPHQPFQASLRYFQSMHNRKQPVCSEHPPGHLYFVSARDSFNQLQAYMALTYDSSEALCLEGDGPAYTQQHVLQVGAFHRGRGSTSCSDLCNFGFLGLSSTAMVVKIWKRALYQWNIYRKMRWFKQRTEAGLAL